MLYVIISQSSLVKQTNNIKGKLKMHRNSFQIKI